MTNPAPGLGGFPDLKPLKQTEFQRLRDLAYERFGLDLREGKQDLVSARLGKKIRELGFSSFAEYIDFVTRDANGQALVEMIDLLTTNFTSFFREKAHFDFFSQILPRLAKEHGNIRIWSAACSTGEEPYSIAMHGREHLTSAHLQIVATDISTRALEKAKAGIYGDDRLRGIAPEILRKYFLRGEGKSSGLYRIKPMLREGMEFRRLNLVDEYSHDRPFSVIWCRNVMIYFDKPTQELVVNKLASWLEPGGYLFIGHSEALNGVRHPLRYVQPAIYQKGQSGR